MIKEVVNPSTKTAAFEPPLLKLGAIVERTLDLRERKKDRERETLLVWWRRRVEVGGFI